MLAFAILDGFVNVPTNDTATAKNNARSSAWSCLRSGPHYPCVTVMGRFAYKAV